MVLRLVIGLAMTVAALAISGRRAVWLYRLISSGQPADDRRQHLGERLRVQLVEVFGQRRLLRWSVPGLAHFFTFWAFVILASVYLEAYGALFDPDFHIPLIGRWPLLGFLQDTIAVLALASLAVFAVIRIRNAPERKARASRFYGSHTGGAWLILFMILTCCGRCSCSAARLRRWVCSPTSRGRGCRSVSAGCWTPCHPGRSRCWRASDCCCTSA
jgi:hypothetical protein